jgi:FkbM family methyltransferase
MTQIEMIKKEVDGITHWFKIKGDDAFVDIVDGWIVSGKKAYMEHVKDRRVCIQAGGYCGIFPRLFAQMFDMVYTFEPDPDNFYCLTLNCQNTNIIKNQAALGDTHEMVNVVRRVDSNRGMNVVVPNQGEAAIAIPTYRIDDLQLNACDLIMLDVEGYEKFILRGAEETIAKFKPVVVVEDTNMDIEELLFKHGYTKRSTTHRDTIYAV